MEEDKTAEYWMGVAVEAASAYRGKTTPNPPVGCALVRDGKLLGVGAHTRAGAPHGEIEALRAAGDAVGATAYVTLEPCDHHGRTGPCTEALIEAGVTRVVVGVRDPNPKAAGGGETLRKHGVQVEYGVLEGACERLMAPFLHVCRTGLPHITLKLASTLDGRIGQPSHQIRITGEDAMRDVHFHRARSCAVLVGSGTVLADDPSLTVRMGQALEGKTPSRVVFDRRLRTPLSSRLVSHAQEFQTLICTEAGRPEADLLREKGVSVLETADTDADEREFVMESLRALAQRGIQHVYCEGGSRLASSLLKHGVVGEVHWYIAPSIGGGGLTAALGDLGGELGQFPLELHHTNQKILGRDLKIEGWLKE